LLNNNLSVMLRLVYTRVRHPDGWLAIPGFRQVIELVATSLTGLPA